MRIEALVEKAWCDLSEPRNGSPVEHLISSVFNLQHIAVLHPKLGELVIHPRAFAWRGREDD